MTDEQRAELRRLVEGVISASAVDGLEVGGVFDEVQHETGYSIREWGVSIHIVDVGQQPPPLTTAQQLALSVLLGEDVPLGVLVSALEESGVYPAGAVEEVRQKAVEQERERWVGIVRTRQSAWPTDTRIGRFRSLEAQAIERLALRILPHP